MLELDFAPDDFDVVERCWTGAAVWVVARAVELDGETVEDCPEDDVDTVETDTLGDDALGFAFFLRWMTSGSGTRAAALEGVPDDTATAPTTLARGGAGSSGSWVSVTTAETASSETEIRIARGRVLRVGSSTAMSSGGAPRHRGADYNGRAG